MSPADAEIERTWHAGRGSGQPLARRYNTSPAANIPILCAAGGKTQIATARWGLVPPWWKDAAPPASSFNARLEEAAEKPMWRNPMRHSRCLVPAAGWYEWQTLERWDPKAGKAGAYKQPHYIRRVDGSLFCFAGLMSAWTTPEQDDPVLSCAILTTVAAGPLARVHDRMPVVLGDAAHAEWLDPAQKDAGRVADTIRRHGVSAGFEHYAVGTAVSDSRSEGPQLVERVP